MIQPGVLQGGNVVSVYAIVDVVQVSLEGEMDFDKVRSTIVTTSPDCTAASRPLGLLKLMEALESVSNYCLLRRLL